MLFRRALCTIEAASIFSISYDLVLLCNLIELHISSTTLISQLESSLRVRNLGSSAYPQ